MKRRLNPAVVVLLLVATAACSHWNRVEPGVQYRHIARGDIDVHVTRVDLLDPSLEIFVPDESARGLTVGEVSERYDAIVAINGDYFDENHMPVGLSIGTCGRWESAGSPRRQWILGLAPGRAEILHPESLESPVPGWIAYAVSGWPALIENCRALRSDQLPGSDSFTRAPHPRTAVGLDRTGRTLFLVVADGRREGVPGMTLPELARFMRDELGVCSALNLDGGGSSEMVVEGEIVNQPSDGAERPVGNHLVVTEGPMIPPCTE